jgi:hypothetical protein
MKPTLEFNDNLCGREGVASIILNLITFGWARLPKSFYSVNLTN